MVRLVVEVPAEDWERVSSAPSGVLAGRVSGVEVRQADGVLAFQADALLVEGLSKAVAAREGFGGDGPAIRVFVRERSE